MIIFIDPTEEFKNFEIKVNKDSLLQYKRLKKKHYFR